MAEKLSNTNVIEQLITSVLDISGRKTSEGEAITAMNSVLESLHGHYDFLKGVEILDARYTEDDRSVSVHSTIEEIPSDEIGEVLHEIITKMHQTLGRRAGHFFMKELRRQVGDDFFLTMQDMGVDLSILQLENEVIR